MTENLLPDHLTPIDPTSLYAALRAASPAAVGQELSRASLLVLLAQIDEETGWKACHAYNLGNVKHVPGDQHDYCQFRCSEIIGGKEVWFDPPHPATSFRAYASLADGCVDYLSLLHKRFASAWPAVLAGDPAAFVYALKAAHYFTADVAVYVRSVLAIHAQLSREIPDDEAALAKVLADVQAGRSILGPIVDNGPGDPPPAAA